MNNSKNNKTAKRFYEPPRILVTEVLLEQTFLQVSEFKKNDYDYPLKNFDIDYWKRTSSSQYLDGGIYGKLGDSWLSKSNLK